MAIYYGAWSYGSPSNGIRIGFDSSWSAVTNASTSVTLTLPVWVNNEGPFSDDQLITYGGVLTGTKAFTNDFAAASDTNVHTKSYTYTYGATEYGSSPGNVTVTAAISGVYNGAAPSVSVAYAIPARPYAAPSAPGLSILVASVTTSGAKAIWSDPTNWGGDDSSDFKIQIATNSGFTGATEYTVTDANEYTITGRSPNTLYYVRVAGTNAAGTGAWSSIKSFTTAPTAPSTPTGVTVSRTSDTQLVASGTLVASSSAPVTIWQWQRWDNVTNVWATIATESGTVTSNTVKTYTNTTTIANRRYQFRLVASNASGSATSVASSATQTTPAAPSNAVATKSGSNIVTTFTEGQSSGMVVTFEVYDKADGAGGVLIATIASGLGTYTHVSPDPAKTHQYAIRAKSTIGATLYGGYAYSNTVQLQAPPNAPTSLTASVKPVPADESTTLTYAYNPVDASVQTKRQYRHRLQGAATWTEVTAVVTSSKTLALTLATWGYSNADTVEWSVRTWGSHADPSPYSATSVIALSARPSATINAPTATVVTSVVTVEFAYYDAEGSAQAEWQAQLKDDTGTVIETRSAASTATTVTFATPVLDASDYSVEVRVKDAIGLWSVWDTLAFTVDYLPPEAITVAATYDADTGSMVLVLTPVGVESGVTVSAVVARVERRIGGGEWVTIADALDPASTLIDPITANVGVNEYRAISTSALPSSVTGDVETVTVVASRWLFLNYGPGFGSVLRCYGNLSLADEASIAQVGHYFENRPKEVAYWGTAETDVYGVSADLDDDSSPLIEWKQAAKYRGPVFMRDMRGTRVYGRMSDGVKANQDDPFIVPMSFTVKAIDD